LKLTISSKNSNAVTLTLYNNTGVTSLGTVTAAGNTTTTLQKTGLAKGHYFMKITAANSNEFAPYILTDALVVPELMAGQPEEDATVSGKSKTGITDVLVYPNPAPTQFRVQLNGEPKAGSTVALLLKNANGETVWSNAKAPV